MRRRCGSRERTVSYYHFGNVGYAISRLSQDILVAFEKRRQIAVIKETYRSQGKAGVLAVHFAEAPKPFSSEISADSMAEMSR
jgi:hypothetical protein